MKMVHSERKAEAASYRETVGAGDYWWRELREGEVLRILDLEGNQAADTLFYAANDETERYSASDTIAAQSALYLTTGTRLISNLRVRGRVIRCATSMIANTCMPAVIAFSEEFKRWEGINVTSLVM